MNPEHKALDPILGHRPSQAAVKAAYLEADARAWLEPLAENRLALQFVAGKATVGGARFEDVTEYRLYPAAMGVAEKMLGELAEREEKSIQAKPLAERVASAEKSFRAQCVQALEAGTMPYKSWDAFGVRIDKGAPGVTMDSGRKAYWNEDDQAWYVVDLLGQSKHLHRSEVIAGHELPELARSGWNR